MALATDTLLIDRLPRLHTYARALTRNRADADDLVQDTVIRVLDSIERFDGRSFGAWSGTILRNRFIDNCRHARFHGGAIEDAPVIVTTQRPTQEGVVELDQTLRVLEDLAPKHREIIVMICIKEFSYARTARMLNIPVGTVRSRLSRARVELLAAVEDDRLRHRGNPPLARARASAKATNGRSGRTATAEWA